jgi:hypothetical protein
MGEADHYEPASFFCRNRNHRNGRAMAGVALSYSCDHYSACRWSAFGPRDRIAHTIGCLGAAGPTHGVSGCCHHSV